MKRVFTLCMALGLFFAADAQRFAGRPATGVTVSVNDRGFAADSRLRAEISRINNKYDRKIDQVRRSLFMRQSVKASMIRSLQNQRQRELDKAFRKFGRDHRYDHPGRRY
jgi:Skp family chaperone for outer membrane proteins